jgi:hypothetical protein
MPTCNQLRLASPLFLYALIIAHSRYQSALSCVGSEPPRMQSLMGFVYYNCTKQAAPGRLRTARAAIRIIARMFATAGVVVPAGECPDPISHGRLDKLPAWLRWLADIAPSEAIALLADNIALVPAEVLAAVELEYNAGLAGACSSLMTLTAGDLATSIASLRAHVHCPTPTVCMPAGPCGPRGRFYYIGAGVGCGIKEAQLVCSHLYVAACPLLLHQCRRVPECRRAMCALESVRVMSTVSW